MSIVTIITGTNLSLKIKKRNDMTKSYQLFKIYIVQVEILVKIYKNNQKMKIKLINWFSKVTWHLGPKNISEPEKTLKQYIISKHLTQYILGLL